LLLALQEAHNRGARIAANRSGTFLIAAAGLLESASGTSVVLPVPGGATRTAEPASSSAALM
jgi:hypothetical protein